MAWYRVTLSKFSHIVKYGEGYDAASSFACFVPDTNGLERDRRNTNADPVGADIVAKHINCKVWCLRSRLADTETERQADSQVRTCKQVFMYLEQ